MPDLPTASPGPRAAPLHLGHAVALIVGIAIGAGIFKAPSLVAANVPSAAWMFGLWALGGLLTLAGALCYAELSSAYPSSGGEYTFLARAYGRGLAMLYAWARFTVITTGSVALLGFVFGDYASQLWPLGPPGAEGSAVYAALAVLLLTALNLRGLRSGAWAQSGLTLLEVGGLVLIVGAGLAWLAAGHPTPAPPSPPSPAAASGLGLAMVFVLLTYGGWNDGAFISADLRGRQAIVRALLLSAALLTTLYLLVVWACWSVLGLSGMAASRAVAADMLAAVAGRDAGRVVAAMVAVSALTSINATLIVGARTAQALARDWPALHGLARWDAARATPPVALVVQGLLALLLIGLGATFEDGFKAMVEYTAPVFWLFFLLTGLSLFRLRRLDRDRERPFRVPLYPLVPATFCVGCTAMLWSSVGYVGSQSLLGLNAAWVGVAVLASGGLGLLLLRRGRA
jgi:amino acid transporter